MIWIWCKIRKDMGKVALVLEGGGLRGIFTAGVTDCFMDHDLDFDYVCGVSAGACNTFAFVGKQRGYLRKCLTQKNRFKSFYGVPQMIESRRFVDLDKLFYEYTEEFGFDFEKFTKAPVKWEMVVSNIETGKAEYMSSTDIEQCKKIGCASCAIPGLVPPVEINGQLYLDGGICDSIPILHTLEQGYDKTVVILTRKKGNYSRITEGQKLIFSRLFAKYPKFYDAICKRSELYREQVKICEELEREGKALIIRPTMQEVSRLESDEDALSMSYYHGFTKAKEFLNQIRELKE